MAQAARKPCTHPGCRTLAVEGTNRCAVHPFIPWTKREGVKRTLVGRRRQVTRDQVAREQPWCPVCDEQGRMGLGTQLDHIVPISAGGSDERSNLQMLCDAHHREKTLREASAGFAR